jgi:V8-like Glu-specific endopeptidase
MGTRLRRLGRLSAVVAATAVTVSAYAAGAAGTARAAAGPAGGTPATQAVVHPVAKAAQASARSFWTAARMKSATPAGQASPGGTGSRQAPQGAAASTPQPPPGIPNPTYFNGVRTVGALFFTTGTQAHFCTASVVDSALLDLVLTAAHCVYGSSYATNVAYVPEWHQGVSPYGSWAVQSITVAAGWKQSQDPNLDFAFLAVAPPPGTSRPIQLVTGGLLLGVNAGYAHPVTVIGYNNTDDQPINCASTSFKFETGQMEFYCNNFQDGTSGGPWILHFNPVTGGGIVFGDIGGYEQGGDYPWASYSVYYSTSILRLFLQAQRQQI